MADDNITDEQLAELVRRTPEAASAFTRSSAACCIASRTDPGEARSRRPARRSHFGCPGWSCGSHLACAGRASPGPGEAQEGFVRLEAALPSRLDNQHRIEHGEHQ